MSDSIRSLTLISAYAFFVSSVQAAPPTQLGTISLIGAKLSTSITSQEEKVKQHPLALLVDGDLATYYWSGSELKKGDTISLMMKTQLPVGKRIKVTTGFGIKNREDGDHLQEGVLESSRDEGRTWSVISTFHAGRAEAKVTFASQHYRIRITKDVNHWVAFREVEVSDAPLTQVTVRNTAKLNGKVSHLSVTTDLEGMERLRPRFQEMAALYFTVWPKLVAWLGVPVEQIPRDIDIIFVKTLSHPAHAGNHTMTMDSRHLINHPQDTEGVFVHELGHIVQHYSTYQPSWFVEGSADYVRYRQYPDRKWAQVQRKRMNNKKPFGFYWDSAIFLLWMEETYQKPIVAPVSRAIHDEKYTDALFQALTGKSIKVLGEEYQASGYRPAINAPNMK